jgi:hypothetical protein
MRGKNFYYATLIVGIDAVLVGASCKCSLGADYPGHSCDQLFLGASEYFSEDAWPIPQIAHCLRRSG